MCRMAEAWMLRRATVAELYQDDPVLIMGDCNDGSHTEAPCNKRASDHGQIIAHVRLKD